MSKEHWPVLHAFNPLRSNCIAALLLCCLLGSVAVATAQQSPERELNFHSLVPLGLEGFLLKPADRALYLFASSQNPAYEGMHQVQVADRQVLLDAHGQQVEFFPETLNFRVTASTWPEPRAVALFPVSATEDINDYLLKLHFRVLIFRGLHVRTVEPSTAGLIGMPADVPYGERIYGLAFNIGHVPIGDRIVLEVLSPDGDRLCKFHLDLL